MEALSRGKGRGHEGVAVHAVDEGRGEGEWGGRRPAVVLLAYALACHYIALWYNETGQ